LFADFFHIAIHRKHTIQFNDKFKNRLTLIKSFAFAFLPKGLIQYTRTPSRRQIRPPQLLFYEFTIDLTSTLSYQSQDKAEVRTRVSGFAQLGRYKHVKWTQAAKNHFPYATALLWH
jgi:hypothetical protein